MDKIKRALIVGGGAIGRGFVPWVLENFEIDFFDIDTSLGHNIMINGGYSTYMSDGDELIRKHVVPTHFTSKISELNLETYDIIFVSVGPRNIKHLPRDLVKTKCPIFSLENDPSTVDEMKAHLSIENIHFGVPDVITSYTASPENLLLDPNCLHTENGILYLQRPDYLKQDLIEALPSIRWLSASRMDEEWDAKLYLHNTPHCVAAYLGYLAGYTYLHEAMQNEIIRNIIEGLVSEILLALKFETPYDHQFMESYASKEVRRFSNRLLFDPIARVAREPIRKLNPGGRLMGALKMMLINGVFPKNMMIGIVAALNYSPSTDSDFEIMRNFELFSPVDFLKYHVGFKNENFELEFISKNFQQASNCLDRLL